MLHENRTWHIPDADFEIEELATHLTQYTWVNCQGFKLGNLLFLNDATSADGGQEYAVVLMLNEKYYQIESITFSWCNFEKALKNIKRCLEYEKLAAQGKEIPFMDLVEPQIEKDSEHRCGHCA